MLRWAEAAAAEGSAFVTGSQTPLFMAARAGQIEAMRTLIEAGADTKAKAQDGSTLLMAAVGSAKVRPSSSPTSTIPTSRSSPKRGDPHARLSDRNRPTARRRSTGAGLRSHPLPRRKRRPLDEKNAAGRTPIDLADILPIDKAVDLLTELILKSGAKPKSPSKR